MTIYTIGFAKKTAEEFFTALRRSKVKRLYDIRLGNKSQLAGFTKQRDLEYFLRTICGIEYVYLPALAPSRELRDPYLAGKLSWEQYEPRYKRLIASRKPALKKSDFKDACLLCVEPTAEHCHRRLAAEHLAKIFGGTKIVHL